MAKDTKDKKKKGMSTGAKVAAGVGAGVVGTAGLAALAARALRKTGGGRMSLPGGRPARVALPVSKPDFVMRGSTPANGSRPIRMPSAAPGRSPTLALPAPATKRPKSKKATTPKSRKSNRPMNAASVHASSHQAIVNLSGYADAAIELASKGGDDKKKKKWGTGKKVAVGAAGALAAGTAANVIRGAHQTGKTLNPKAGTASALKSGFKAQAQSLKKSFKKKNLSAQQAITSLSSYADAAIELATATTTDDDEIDPKTGKKKKKTGVLGKIAGAAAVGAGATYLRGRYANPGKGVGETLKSGLGAFGGDAKNAAAAGRAGIASLLKKKKPGATPLLTRY